MAWFTILKSLSCTFWDTIFLLHLKGSLSKGVCCTWITTGCANRTSKETVSVILSPGGRSVYWRQNQRSWWLSINQSNFYSANIPNEARLSGTTAKSKKQFYNINKPLGFNGGWKSGNTQVEVLCRGLGLTQVEVLCSRNRSHWCQRWLQVTGADHTTGYGGHRWPTLVVGCLDWNHCQWHSTLFWSNGELYNDILTYADVTTRPTTTRCQQDSFKRTPGLQLQDASKILLKEHKDLKQTSWTELILRLAWKLAPADIYSHSVSHII